MVFHWLRRKIEKEYFRAGIIGADNEIHNHKVVRSEIKKFGYVLTWKKADGARYRLFPELLKKYEKHVFGLWNENNPIQIDLNNPPPNMLEKAIADRKINHIIKSAQELDDVADNKITHDALRYSMSKLDFVHIGLLIASIVISGISLYYIYQAVSDMNTIINYLNQLIQLGKLPPPSGVG